MNKRVFLRLNGLHAANPTAMSGVAKNKTVAGKRVNYWSSTEYSATNAWNLNMNNGNRWNNSKTTNQNRVRPVSALKEGIH